MNSAIVRIVMRYAAGALVAKGVVDADLGRMLATDKDVFTLLSPIVDMAVATLPGMIVGAATEAWYAMAKRFGWKL